MKNGIIGVLVGIIFFLSIQWFLNSRKENNEIIKSTQLIEKQIKNTGKLIVTEGYFSEIISYKDVKTYFSDWLSFDKKALIVVNAEALVSYDLHLVEYDIDSENHVVTIKKIPEPEIKIFPKLSYHSLDESQFNSFTAEDHNKIREKAQLLIQEKVENSTLKTNATNRLISELSKMLILTKSMGWTLRYNGNSIETENDFLP